CVCTESAQRLATETHSNKQTDEGEEITCDEFLDLEDICLSTSGKPEITLLVDGKPVNFLCDSGACRTAIMNGEGFDESGEFVLERSPNGHRQRTHLTKPISIHTHMTRV